MQGLLIWIFGTLTVYLVVADVLARLRYAKESGEPLEWNFVRMKRERLLPEIRSFLAQHAISESWLLEQGGEKEVVSCHPGSIFGRCVTTVEFGHRLPVPDLESASVRQLRRIYARRNALSAFHRQRAVGLRKPERALAGQAC